MIAYATASNMHQTINKYQFWISDNLRPKYIMHDFYLIILQPVNKVWAKS